MIDFNATTWEAVAVVITAALTGISVVHAVTPRPKIRTFYDAPKENKEGTWVPLGVVVYVVNVGRAAAIIRGAGLRNAQGAMEFHSEMPSSLVVSPAQGRSPMTLQPGEIVAYFVPRWPTPGTAEQFGARELRTWRLARAAARLPARARRRVPKWTKERWHPATGPDRPDNP